jgi:hypothetical protein
VPGSGALPAGLRYPLARRRRARQWAALTHTAGLLLPGGLMLATEGAAAPPGGGQSNMTAAWWNVVCLVVLATAQLASLATWRGRARELRAAGGYSRGASPYLSGGPSRRAFRVCVALLVLAAWTAQAGYAAQAVASVRSGGYNEPQGGLTIGLLALALTAGVVAVITGALALRSPGQPPFAALPRRRPSPRSSSRCSDGSAGG